MSSARGFTLMEMMLVLAIAAALTAVAVPNLQPALAAMRLRGAASDVASALRHVRGHALSSGREATFTLDIKRHAYQVSSRAKSYALPDSVRLRLFTAEQELVGEDLGRIRFFPDGSATGGRVTLEAGGNRRLVDVNWLTGDVTVREEREE
jgi:general secretion pathway protein H